jgi:hypothetical protein
MELTLNREGMNLPFFVNIYTGIWAKSWKIAIGLFATWTSALFGKPIMLFITPEVTGFLKIAIPSLATVGSVIWTGYIAWKRGRKELQRQEQERQQDEKEFFLDHMRKLIEVGIIKEDATEEEKIETTKRFIEFQYK